MHEDVKDEYLARLVAAARERIVLGDPFDDATTMGPVNNEPTAAKTERHALEAGAAVVAGGTRSPRHGSELFFEAEGCPPASL